MHDVLSAESLKGGPVFNGAGEQLGKLEDFMLDVESGRIRYAVLSFGGVLHLGNKLFAVPAEALTVEGDRVLLDVDKRRLEQAPGFDKVNWPDFADPALERSIRAFYGSKPDRG